MTGIVEGIAISAAASLLSAGLTYALTPGQEFDVGRQKDLTPANQGFGSPLPWLWGTVRVPGVRIGASYKEEVKKTKKQGGLFSKTKVTTYYYYGYYATAFCECPFRPVVSINRLWFDKKVVFSDQSENKILPVLSGKFYNKTIFLDFFSPTVREHLNFYLGLSNQTIDSAFNSMNLIASGNSMPILKQDRDKYLLSHSISPITVPRVNANNSVCYYSATRLPLKDYFDRLPVEEAEITASDNCTVGQIFGDLFGIVYPDYNFDISHISTSEFVVDGFSINGIQAAKNSIQDLQKNHFIDLIQTGNGFKFIPINSPRNVVNLTYKDLGAYQSGTQKPLDFERIDPDPDTLPTKVVVSYKDPTQNYDRNLAESNLIVRPWSKSNIINITTNEIMSETKAQTLADRSLMMAFILASKYKFSLPPRFLDLEPCDLITNLFDNSGYPIKLIHTRPGANLLIECEGVLHDTSPLLIRREPNSHNVIVNLAAYNQEISVFGKLIGVTDDQGNNYFEGTDYTINASGNIEINEDGNIIAGSELNIIYQGQSLPAIENFGTYNNPGNTSLQILDIPLINNEEKDYQLYLAAGGGSAWSGCTVYLSNDNLSYYYHLTFETSSIYGQCTTDVIEQKITVKVNGELDSISHTDLNFSLNMALIGNQIVQFKNADLIDIDLYQLSGITWGLRGTETQPLPKSGDRFVMLVDYNSIIENISYSANEIGQVKYIKALSEGQTLDEVDPYQHVILGISQRPYAPINLAATTNTEGDITITWDRRDRHDQSIQNPLLSETAEDYVVEIISSGNIIRTFQENKNSAIYTAINQQEDFGAIQTNITVKIAQVSSSYGVGSYSTSYLTPSP